MIYSLDQIVHVHLEISSRCNAACPLCPRNYFGYPHNSGYDEYDMTLAQAQQIFQPEFIAQLRHMQINGNFGDAIMNPDTVAIVEYFRQHNPELHINICTNGSARSRSFWQGLADHGAEVTFCIDGLDQETHARYRQNTLYSQVVKNAQTFIQAGGRAIWKMIRFDHNQHQIDTARELSREQGFAAFLAVDDGRNTGPVYNNSGDLTHILGAERLGYKPADTVHPALQAHTDPEHRKHQIYWINQHEPRDINCEVAHSRSIYINSLGQVYPCCYLGLNPLTYRDNSIIGWGLEQVAQMVQRNSALEYTLSECIEWFNDIEASWQKPTFESGRLFLCNRQCGQAAPYNRQFHVHSAEYTDNQSS